MPRLSLVAIAMTAALTSAIRIQAAQDGSDPSKCKEQGGGWMNTDTFEMHHSLDLCLNSTLDSYNTNDMSGMGPWWTTHWLRIASDTATPNPDIRSTAADVPGLWLSRSWGSKVHLIAKLCLKQLYFLYILHILHPTGFWGFGVLGFQWYSDLKGTRLQIRRF